MRQVIFNTPHFQKEDGENKDLSAFHLNGYSRDNDVEKESGFFIVQIDDRDKPGEESVWVKLDLTTAIEFSKHVRREVRKFDRLWRDLSDKEEAEYYAIAQSKETLESKEGGNHNG